MQLVYKTVYKTVYIQLYKTLHKLPIRSQGWWILLGYNFSVYTHAKPFNKVTVLPYDFLFSQSSHDYALWQKN